MYEYKVIPCYHLSLEQMHNLYDSDYKKDWKILWFLSHSFIIKREISFWQFIKNEMRMYVKTLFR